MSHVTSENRGPVTACLAAGGYLPPPEEERRGPDLWAHGAFCSRCDYHEVVHKDLLSERSGAPS